MPIYNFPSSEPNFLETHRLTLEAGRVKVLEAYGRAVVCVFAQSPFEMSFNNGRYFDMWQGAKWILQESERFNTLKLLSDRDQTITILTGNFLYDQTSVTTVVQAAKTIIKPSAVTSIDAAGVITLDGEPPSGGTYRKHLIIGNLDPASDLDVLDSEDNEIGWVPFRESHVFETSDVVKIKNNTAAPINLRIMELFYTAE